MRYIIILLLISSSSFAQKVITQATVIDLPDSLLSKEERINPPNTIKKYINGYKQFVSLNTDSITEGSTNFWFTNSHSLGTVLTGYVSGAGTVASTDNILQAIQKLNGNDALKLSLSGGTLTGHLLFTDNTYDIGADGATRPRTGYFGTSLMVPLINGSSSSSGTLTLSSTTNGTKGRISFGNSSYDEVNNRLGIGISVGTAVNATIVASDQSGAGRNLIQMLDNQSTINFKTFATKFGALQASTAATSIGMLNAASSGGIFIEERASGATLPLNSIGVLVPSSWTFVIKGAAQSFTMLQAGNIGLGVTSPTSQTHTTSFAAGYVAKTGTYTATAVDYTIDCTSGSFTVTLPTAVGITGRVYIIKNSGAGTITMAGTSSQTFDGAASPTIAAGAVAQYQSNNANWIKIN